MLDNAIVLEVRLAPIQALIDWRGVRWIYCSIDLWAAGHILYTCTYDVAHAAMQTGQDSTVSAVCGPAVYLE